jgi:hypothetical protein
MNLNYATQHQGRVAWDGTAATPIDIRRHVGYSFTFEATANVVADAVFNVEAARPMSRTSVRRGPSRRSKRWSTANSGRQRQGHRPPSRSRPALAGTVCTAALPCKPNAFVRLASGGGDTAKVKAVAILSGPR